MRVLHLSRQQKVAWDAGCSLSICETSTPPSTMTFFLPPGHISFNKAISHNSVTPYWGHSLSNHHNAEFSSFLFLTISPYIFFLLTYFCFFFFLLIYIMTTWLEVPLNLFRKEGEIQRKIRNLKWKISRWYVERKSAFYLYFPLRMIIYSHDFENIIAYLCTFDKWFYVYLKVTANIKLEGEYPFHSH